MARMKSIRKTRYSLPLEIWIWNYRKRVMQVLYKHIPMNGIWFIFVDDLLRESTVIWVEKRLFSVAIGRRIIGCTSKEGGIIRDYKFLLHRCRVIPLNKFPTHNILTLPN